MSEAKRINITAKTGNREAIISLWEKELICNLRALVAVRFEQPIADIVLIYGGEILGDGGTIDSHGIKSGVTVHVIFRKLQPKITMIDASTQCSDEMDSETTETIQAISTSILMVVDDPSLVRDMLQKDTLFTTLLHDNLNGRNFLNNDSSLREAISATFSSARLDELRRRRDMLLLRMESIPGGLNILAGFNQFIQDAFDNMLARRYRYLDILNQRTNYWENPQRGRENNSPLPNPWSVEYQKQKNNRVIVTKVRSEMRETIDAMRKLCNSKLYESFTYEPERVERSWGFNPNRSVPTVINNVSLSERYKNELNELIELGHMDRPRNLFALLLSLGNVKSAAKLLDSWKS